jgi:hypothetical protein
MPVLGQHHIVELHRQAVDEPNHLVAFRHGERSAGHEVVLHVDHHETGVAVHFSLIISPNMRSAAV